MNYAMISDMRNYLEQGQEKYDISLLEFDAFFRDIAEDDSVDSERFAQACTLIEENILSNFAESTQEDSIEANL